DVEVVDLDPGDLRPDAAGVALAADLQRLGVLDRMARGDGHPVPALLAGDAEVGESEVLEHLPGELARLALDLLQAQNVGRHFVDHSADELATRADRVDVPGGETKAHGFQIRGFG